MYTGIDINVKYPLFFLDFKETRIFCIDIRKKLSGIKFHENPSIGTRVVPCGRTDRETHNKVTSYLSLFYENA